MKRVVFFCIFILCAFDLPAQVKPHPRLLEQPQIHSDAPWYVLLADSVITAYSDKVLDLPPKERIIEGRRLLHTSQEVLKRVFFLSYTYRVHGGERYARRAVDEMLAASRFTDWNPVHFLDVGEMTMGLAIGYDWLYEKMTPAERKEIASAILKKGLDAALRYPDYAWFYNSDVNWNSVCNAGLIYGALAVWEEDPEFCRQMLDKSIKSKQLAFNAFSDDGRFPEGYNYWAYGSSSQIMLEAAFPVSFKASEASYDLGLGHIRRGNNTLTAYEVPGHQWADITADDGSYGVTILNDGRYGWDKPDDARISVFAATAVLEEPAVAREISDSITRLALMQP